MFRMTRKLLTILALGLIAASCEASKGTPSPTVQTVTVTAAAGATSVSFANRNQTSQLAASARLTDGTSTDVTGTATWASSASTVATVSGTGLVTALTNGATTITATHLGQVGSLAATVAMRATAEVTPTFARLCSPNRAQMAVVIRESSNNIGFRITLLEITMTDINGVQRYHRALSAADVSALAGSNIVGPGASRTVTVESGYPGGVNVEDSTGRVILTAVDDAGNAISITLNSISMRDRC
jgi:hypothetical protein